MPSDRGAAPDLPAVRRKKGISLEEIAQATKINVNYLQAIEDGNFERLPGGIYTISYLRQYARAIEHDETELLEYYYQKMGPPAEIILAELPRKPLAQSYRLATPWRVLG